MSEDEKKTAKRGDRQDNQGGSDSSARPNGTEKKRDNSGNNDNNFSNTGMTGSDGGNESDNEQKNEEAGAKINNIEKSGSVIAKNSREAIHCLSIIGQIEGHYLLGNNQKATKYEHIIPLLVSIEESEEVDGLLVVLNTMGGDVEAGLAIAEMIASMTKPTVSIVLGGGHSIGVPLAVAAKRSFIVPSATMTIHPVRINGLVIGVPQTFRHFSEMQKRIVRFICDHSSATPEKIYELMMKPDEIATDVGSIIDGHEAVKYGIIDEVGGLDAALAALRRMISEHKNENSASLNKGEKAAAKE
jgi:ATP-dependent protease ClpP protease subunit